MESAARAAGIADYPTSDHDLENGTGPREQHYTNEISRDPDPLSSSNRKRSNTAHSQAYSDRVPIPLSGRRSFSTGRRTPAASVRSRAGSTFTTRTGDDGIPDVPPTPSFGPGVVLSGPPRPPAPGEIGQAITTEGDEEDEEEEDGPPWNSLHPCWPHLNPHVPLASPLYASTRIIRLQRDYRTAGDLYPQYVTSFPEILEPYLSQEDFKALVQPLNGLLREVFDPSGKRHWLDAVVGLATGWLWEDVGLSGVKKGVKRLEEWTERWNEKVGRPRGVEVISLRRTAFLCLDLQVPDPSGLIVAEGLQDGVEHSAGMNGHAINGDARLSYGPTTDGGTSVVGATTEARTETEAQSTYSGFESEYVDRSEPAGHDGTFFISGNMSSGGNSAGRRRDELEAGRPDVPVIPRQYEGQEKAIA